MNQFTLVPPPVQLLTVIINDTHTSLACLLTPGTERRRWLQVLWPLDSHAVDASDSSLLKTCRGDREKIASMYVYMHILKCAHGAHTHKVVQCTVWEGVSQLVITCCLVYSVYCTMIGNVSISKKITATAREFDNH